MGIREQNGFSQGEIVKGIGASRDIIVRYQRRVITPSIEVIIKISDDLQVSNGYLVGNYK